MERKVYRIRHSARGRLFVPLAAIEDNVAFVTDTSKDWCAKFADGKDGIVTSRRFVNALSQEGRNLAATLYGMGVTAFLDRWYAATEGRLTSLEFVYMEATCGS